jgi:hypothetical protein
LAEQRNINKRSEHFTLYDNIAISPALLRFAAPIYFTSHHISSLYRSKSHLKTASMGVQSKKKTQKDTATRTRAKDVGARLKELMRGVTTEYDSKEEDEDSYCEPGGSSSEGNDDEELPGYVSITPIFRHRLLTSVAAQELESRGREAHGRKACERML